MGIDILCTLDTLFPVYFNVGQPLFCTHAFCRHTCRIYLQNKTEVSCKEGLVFNYHKDHFQNVFFDGKNYFFEYVLNFQKFY